MKIFYSLVAVSIALISIYSSCKFDKETKSAQIQIDTIKNSTMSDISNQKISEPLGSDPSTNQIEPDHTTEVVKQEVQKASDVGIQTSKNRVKENIPVNKSSNPDVKIIQNKSSKDLSTKPNEEIPARPATKQEVNQIPNAPLPQKASTLMDHGPWNIELSKFVSATGKVNYALWKKNRSDLDTYIKSMAEEIISSSTSYKEKLAYWINVYNANTIKLILDHYPIASIQDIAGGKPWDERFIKSGNTYFSLNDIENKIVRPMGEPRIHFALNCGAKSCPPLSNKAFTASNLDTQLKANTSKFLSSQENYISKNNLIISKIFEWYSKDFPTLKEWISIQSGVEISPNAKVTYKTYNWSLNQ